MQSLSFAETCHNVVLFGYPLGHTVSPSMHHAAAGALGIRLNYRAVEVVPALLAGAVAKLRNDSYLGANVTLPHKQAMIPHVDSVTSFARRVGAINTVYKADGLLIGDNTDAPAFIDALRLALSFSSSNERVLVLGAGGAARAAVAALIDCDVQAVSLWNRTGERARELAAHMAPLQNARTKLHAISDTSALETACQAATLLVNATSAGLHAGRLPIDFKRLAPTCRVFDMLYGPGGTAFTREARGAGLTAEDGLWMLVYQAARSFKLWTGKQADAQLMHDAAFGALSGRAVEADSTVLRRGEPVR